MLSQVAGDRSLNRPHFGSSGSVHDGSLRRIRLVCYADSSNFSVEWNSSTLAEQVAVAVGDTVVAGGLVVGTVRTTVGHTTVDWLVDSIEDCNAEVDAVGDVDSVGNRCSASVHHDSADCIVGSCLVPGHLFGIVCCAAACWSVDAPWHDVLVVDSMVLVEHGIAPLSAVLAARVVLAFHFFIFLSAVSNAIFLCDLDRFVGSRIFLCVD